MSVSQQKITVYFSSMTEAYGLRDAAKLHRQLLDGAPYTPELRAKVRTIAAKEAQKKERCH